MPTLCTDDDGGSIQKGHAVCINGWDGLPNNRPKVKRATQANLTGTNAKTIYGVARENSVGVPPNFTVNILVAGEIADLSITGLATGTGKSRLVVTDFDNSTAALQCKLRHIDDSPAVQERFVVGSSDENGTLAIQPRHTTDETGFPKVTNVKAYGALPDGSTNASPAMAGALQALPSDAVVYLAGSSSDWRIDSPLIAARGNVTIYGDGADKTRVRMLSPQYFLLVDSTSPTTLGRVTLRGLTIDGGSGARAAYCAPNWTRNSSES